MMNSLRLPITGRRSGAVLLLLALAGSCFGADYAARPREQRPSVPGTPMVTSASDGVISIQWADRSSNETGFIVEHQLENGSGWNGAGTYTVGANVVTTTVQAAAGTHRFRVCSSNKAGESRWTSWSVAAAVAGPPAPPVPPPPNPTPAPPENLAASPAQPPAVQLRWDDRSSNEAGFQIERSPAFANGIRNVGANVSSFTDPVTVGSFSYRVRSQNAAGFSAYTPWVQIVLTQAPPAAPSSPSARDEGNERDVRVLWVDNSDNETSFSIERERQVGAMWVDSTQLSAGANAISFVDQPGPGVFRYRVAARNAVGLSSWTSWATVVASTGWTQFTASNDTRVIYVSSSLGNDSNSGLSEATPKRTIAAGYAQLRHGYPDWMLLKRGDTWVNESLGHWRKSGRSDAEKMLVGTYGPLSQPRPYLQTGTSNGFTRTGGNGSPQTIDNIAVVGLRFRPHTRTPTTGGTGFSWLDGGSNVLVEDCMFEGYKSNFSVQGYTGVLTNFKVRRCLVLDAYSGDSHSQGMYFSKTDGILIEGCIVDHNGWKEGEANPTIFNHNIYIQPNCQGAVVRNNFIARASSHGLQLRGGGEAHRNVLVANPISMLLGTGGADGGGSDPTFPVITNASYNVILEGRDMSPGNPRGFGMDVLFASGGDIHHNILANIGAGSAPRPIHLDGSQGDGNRNLIIRNNIIHNWGGSVTFRGGPAQLQDITFVDNTIQATSGTWPLMEHVSPDALGEVDPARNRFYSPGAANGWMRIGNATHAFTAWRDMVDDEGSVAGQISFPNPSRTVGSYASSQGLGATLETYIERLRQVRRGDWPEALTPEALASYVRQGFAMADPQ